VLTFIPVRHHSYDYRTLTTERRIVYLTQYDVFAIIIALLGLMFLVFTTFRANARLTRQRDEWREQAIELYNEVKLYENRTERI
jgi:hypothetical protein